MRILRKNTFETNSSSTHSITMCSKSDFDKWVNGEIYYDVESCSFCTEEEREEIIKKLIISSRAKYNWGNRKDGVETTIEYKGKIIKYDDRDKELYSRENINEVTNKDIEKYLENDIDYYDIPLTYEQYNEYISKDYEEFSSSYITKDGEEIIAFGYYGYDC